VKLDIGCGTHKLAGAVGIDLRPLPGVDVVQNLNEGPWKLKDHQFSYIRCQHVIEHVQNLSTLVKEIHRVAAHDCEVEFRTPHYSSWTSWGDPTHCHHFGLTSIPQLFEMELPRGAYEVISTELRFTGSFMDLWGWLMYKWSPKKYEKYFAWRHPAHEIVCRIRIKK
jgi:hypothetical protein